MNNSEYKIIRVALDRDLVEQIGKDIYFDLVDHDRVHSFHVLGQTPFNAFKEEVAEELGIPAQFQRFWKWARRQNNTYRPVKPLTAEEESKPVGQLKEISNKKSVELNLFLEVELGPHHCPVAPPVKSDQDILVFFKLYDPATEVLRYVGRLFVNGYTKPSDIFRKLNEMAGFSPLEELDIYEEIKFKPSLVCEPVNVSLSFRANQIEDGDIICFQKAEVQSAGSFGHPTVSLFLEQVLAFQEMEAQNRPRERFTWRISNFSRLNSTKCYSDVFNVNGCKWHILIYPKGNGNNLGFTSIYLEVADYTSLPIGWSRTADFNLSVINQNSRDSSRTKETSHKFTWIEHDWGFTSFMPLSELHDTTKGYLVQDTLVIEANIVVHKAVPRPVLPSAVPSPTAPPADALSTRETDRYVSYFKGLDEFIGASETSAFGEGPSSGVQTSSRVPLAPNLEEVENAKQSLKECLSDLFKLNMKDRLASALSTLSFADTGLSLEQRRSVLEFRANFDDIMSDYLTFEQDNSEYELQKLENDLLVSAMKKNRETHLYYKELSEKLTREEEELKKKLEETRLRNVKLISDWEALMAESEETKSKFVAQKPKLAVAEERKRIAEERMSRSSTAWSSLKAQFL